jgi:hypothetical protein
VGVAAYTVFTASSRKAAEQQKRLDAATKEVNNNLSIQANIVKGIQGDFSTASRDLAVFSGQMSQLDADIASAREANAKALEDDLRKQDDIILNNEKNIQLARKAADVNKELTEEEKERLNNAIALTKDKLLQGALDSHGAAITQKMFILEQHIKKENERQLQLRQGIVIRRGDELEATEELIKLQAELQKTQEEGRRENNAEPQPEHEQRNERQNSPKYSPASNKETHSLNNKTSNSFQSN